MISTKELIIGTVTVMMFFMLVELPLVQGEPEVRSHRPVRSLPEASNRPFVAASAFFVDDSPGDDSNSGSKAQPWKTIRHAITKLKAGDTLYLRGGTYYEQVVVTAKGTKTKPVTIRSYPGEIVVIDGGLREFFNQPAKAWEPVVGGAVGEFRSSRAHPQLVRAVGNFADSMIPLHSYGDIADLISTTELPLPRKPGQTPPRYFGPGLFYHAATKRIHIRLVHTHVRAFGAGNYRGETDPRKMKLVIAGWSSTPLSVRNAKHVRFQDLVFRGGGDTTVLVTGSNHVEFDGVTIYTANRGMRVETTGHLKVTKSWFRGSMPPWGSRTVSKNRAIDSHLFVPVGTYNIQKDKRKYLSPQCHDFEISYCEFTDGHDGVYVGGVQRFSFHHNLVDNMNDDGVYLSAWGPSGSDVRVFQNRLSRCLTIFAFGLGRNAESDPGTGTSIFRNVIDLRGPVPYGHPHPNDPALKSYGRLNGDHGGPVWEPLFFYHNTVITNGPAFRGYYAAGWGGHMRGAKRRVFNNMFLQITKSPGLKFESVKSDLQVDGNLHWGYQAGVKEQTRLLELFRQSPIFSASKKQYPPGWAAHDLFADPLCRSVKTGWRKKLDVRLQTKSPAVNAGVAIPASWPDPFRKSDFGKPDLGAYPLGTKSLHVGPRAILTNSP
jgi:hypothetical protein